MVGTRKVIESIFRSARSREWEDVCELASKMDLSQGLELNGVPLLHYLIEQDAPAVVVLNLLGMGYPSRAHKNYFVDPLALCLHAARTDQSKAEIFAILLKYGADPNGFVDSGRTLLHEAVARNLEFVTRQLLAAGANPLKRDAFGLESETALELACKLRNRSADVVIDWCKTES